MIQHFLAKLPFLFAALIFTACADFALGDEWSVGSTNVDLVALGGDMKIGDAGSSISFVTLMDDWLVVVITEATRCTPPPFAFYFSIEKERYQYVVCHNAKTGEWRSLELPKSLPVDSYLSRVRGLGAGAVGMTFQRLDSGSSSDICIQWELQKNVVTVGDKRVMETQAAFRRFYKVLDSQRDSDKRTKYDKQRGVVDGIGWLRGYVNWERQCLQNDNKSNTLTGLRLLNDEDFEVDAFDLESGKSTRVQSKASIETAFAGEKLVQMELPLTSERFDQSPVAGFVFEQRHSVCASLNSPTEFRVDIGKPIGGFEEIDKVVLSQNGEYMAVSGYATDKEGVDLKYCISVVRISGNTRESQMRVQNEFLVAEDHHRELFAVSEDGKHLFSNDDLEIYICDSDGTNEKMMLSLVKVKANR